MKEANYKLSRGLVMVAAAFLAVVFFASASQAMPRWGLGGNYQTYFGDSDSRVDEMTGYGGFFRFFHTKHIAQRVSVDIFEFELENPIEAMGRTPGSAEANADASGYRIHFELEYHFMPGRFFQPYVGFGGGYYNFDVGDIRGADTDGVAYDLKIRTADVVGVAFVLGADLRIIENLAIGVVGTYLHTFDEFEVQDRLAGEDKVKIDTFSGPGVVAQLTFRF